MRAGDPKEIMERLRNARIVQAEVVRYRNPPAVALLVELDGPYREFGAGERLEFRVMAMMSPAIGAIADGAVLEIHATAGVQIELGRPVVIQEKAGER